MSRNSYWNLLRERLERISCNDDEWVTVLRKIFLVSVDKSYSELMGFVPIDILKHNSSHFENNMLGFRIIIVPPSLVKNDQGKWYSYRDSKTDDHIGLTSSNLKKSKKMFLMSSCNTAGENTGCEKNTNDLQIIYASKANKLMRLISEKSTCLALTQQGTLTYEFQVSPE